MRAAHAGGPTVRPLEPTRASEWRLDITEAGAQRTRAAGRGPPGRTAGLPDSPSERARKVRRHATVIRRSPPGSAAAAGRARAGKGERKALQWRTMRAYCPHTSTDRTFRDEPTPPWSKAGTVTRPHTLTSRDQRRAGTSDGWQPGYPAVHRGVAWGPVRSPVHNPHVRPAGRRVGSQFFVGLAEQSKSTPLDAVRVDLPFALVVLAGCEHIDSHGLSVAASHPHVRSRPASIHPRPLCGTSRSAHAASCGSSFRRACSSSRCCFAHSYRRVRGASAR